MQILVFTSNKYLDCLPPFAWLFNKYWGVNQEVVVCGYQKPLMLPSNFQFFQIAAQEYPANRWSDALIYTLQKKAQEIFLFLLEDYWLLRTVNVEGVKILKQYMQQHPKILKIDVATDRLYSNGGATFLFNQNTVDFASYLDLIETSAHTPYNMSLWGGLWRRDLLRKVLTPQETAQQVELQGSTRVDQLMESEGIRVLGTRQAPLIHGNVWQSNKEKAVLNTPYWRIVKADLVEMRKQGLLSDRYNNW